jgi:glycerol 3-phosphatase-2
MNQIATPTIIPDPADCEWAFSYYENNRHRLPKASFPNSSITADNLEAVADEFDIFVLDAFGVLNVGDGPIEGAPERIAALQKAGKRVIVLTNGATFNARKSQQKYAGFGFDFELNDVVASRDVLAAELKNHDPDFQWGVAAIPEANLVDFGTNFHLLGDDQSDYDSADGMILLSSLNWNMSLHAKMLQSLEANPRPLLVGNPDVVAPREDRFSIEPGFYAHDIANRTSVEPLFCGKPFTNSFDAVKARLDSEGSTLPPSRIAMVGDTLHTDILGGAAAGFRTILVENHGLFRGQNTVSYIDRCGIVPDFIVPTT